MHERPLSVALLGLVNENAIAEAADWAAKEDALLAGCHPSQRDFVVDPSLRIAALVGRGGGKTSGGIARFIRRMMRTPRAECLYIAPTRGVAEKLVWARLKDILSRLGIAASFHETKLECTLERNRARLYLAGADDKKQIEKYRGQPFHEVGIDECASLSQRILEHLIHRIIGPRLGDHNGTLWLTGTPSHQLFGEFYDITRPGADRSRRYDERDLEAFTGWIDWSLHAWSLEDAARSGVRAMQNLWQRALHDKQANGWSDNHPVWRREYLGQWAADDTENIYKYKPHLDDGTPWNQWDPERIEGGFAKLPEGHSEWAYAFGADLGHSDPFGLVIFAWDPNDTSKTLYHVFEFEKRAMYARTIAELLIGEELNHDRLGGVMRTIGWPESIMVDAAHLGQALIDELTNVYGIRVDAAPRKPSDKHDAIELFNGDLTDGRIKILKGSKLETQLASLQWEIDEWGRLKEPRGQPNDLTDAAIYARRGASHLFAEAAATPKRVLPPSPMRDDPDADLKKRRKRDDFGEVLQDDGYFEDWQDEF